MEHHASGHRDTMIARLVSELREELSRLPEQLESPGQPMSSGITSREFRGFTHVSLYKLARALCDAGDFESALLIALHLVANHGRDARHAFLAGSCLQRIGIHAEAGNMFTLALTLDDGDAASMYRLGECLGAQGRTGDAIRAFRATVDMAREKARHRPLQELAMTRLEALNSSIS
jgi:tetratricopeptide (TPR) repeat protein